jgi:hypothetical protein
MCDFFFITVYSVGLSPDVKFSVTLQGFPVFHLCVSTSQRVSTRAHSNIKLAKTKNLKLPPHDFIY